MYIKLMRALTNRSQKDSKTNNKTNYLTGIGVNLKVVYRDLRIVLNAYANADMRLSTDASTVGEW